MAATSTLFMLDTNVLLACIRGGKLGKHIRANYPFDHAGFDALICVVSVGEILSLSKKFAWGEKPNSAMQELLDSLVTIDINAKSVLEAYATIDHFSESKGRRMGKNDVWIAAAANVSGATLLTTDSDFDHLEAASLVSVAKINPAMGK